LSANLLIIFVVSQNGLNHFFMQHLKYLNKFLWNYRKTLFLGIFFIFITNIFAIYPAEFVRTALDSLLERLNDSENKGIYCAQH
jgi:hypothetical protein